MATSGTNSKKRRSRSKATAQEIHMDTGTGEGTPNHVDQETFSEQGSQNISGVSSDLDPIPCQVLSDCSVADLALPQKRGCSEVMELDTSEIETHPKMLKNCNGERVAAGQSSSDSNFQDFETSSENGGIPAEPRTSVSSAKISEIRDLISNLTNMNACNLEGVLNLSVAQKTLVFELQSTLLQSYSVFGKMANEQNPDPSKNVTSAVEKLKLTLEKWKWLAFDNLQQGEFVICEEMEKINVKCVHLVSAALVSASTVIFFAFLDESISLIELLYLNRLANAICLGNFSLDLESEDDFIDAE